MNNFVVIGLGNFGYNIAISLARKGKHVLVIDSDPEPINRIKDIVSDAIIGDAKKRDVLEEFIDKDINAVIISTGVNIYDSILSAHHVNEIGIKNIIVKANDETHAQLLKLMGATEIIFPEKDIAEWWANKLSEPNLIELIPLTSEFGIVEAAIPDRFSGKTLKAIQLRTKFGVLVIAVKDILLDKFILMPGGDFKLGPDMLLILMGRKEDLGNLKF